VDTEPSYLRLARTGELARRVHEAYQRLASCDICPRECGVDRRTKPADTGCRTGERARVASYSPHFGEEAPLVGRGGSGTIFFSGCNLKCQYCQNSDISQSGIGDEVEPEHLAKMMLHLQALGCHNINFVSPSHVVPQILAALLVAAAAGIHIPLVYNTGGYDSIKTLRLLDGIIDIYMPDMKYSDEATARHLSRIKGYPATNLAAVEEMHRQVGDLRLDSDGIAVRGLLVRHLVLPQGLAGTAEVARSLVQHISKDTYINIMDQYRPCYRAHEYPELSRSVTHAECARAVGIAREAGLRRFDQRCARLPSHI
jgi:putative pyruvate formate lyase activating enzyme